MVTNEALAVCETVLLLHYYCLDFSARHDLLDNVKTDGQSLSGLGKKICMLYTERVINDHSEMKVPFSWER